jgi:hypothetical protein
MVVSGVEIASLALAVVPIIHSAGQLYKQGYGTGALILRKAEKNRRLLNFTRDLVVEIAMLQGHIHKAFQNLSSLSEDQLPKVKDLNWAAWEKDEVDRALMEKLGPNQARAFAEIVSDSLRVLEHLVQDSTAHLMDQAELVSNHWRLQWNCNNHFGTPIVYKDLAINSQLAARRRRTIIHQAEGS